MQYRPFVLPRRFRKLTHVLLRANERTFYSIRTEQSPRHRFGRLSICFQQTFSLCDGREGWAPLWGQPGGRGSRVLAQRGPVTPVRTSFVGGCTDRIGRVLSSSGKVV